MAGEGAANLAQPFVGRQNELDAVAIRRLNAHDGRSDVVVIRGEPGIGKTRLIRAIEVDAVANGFRVASITGAEAEGSMALAALSSLVNQATGIRATTELTEMLQAIRPSSPLTLGSAVLESLAESAAKEPTLLVVDDSQWIDGPSAHALVFALRRLADERLLAVVAIRSGQPSAFDNAGFDEMTLTRLATSDLRRLSPTDIVESVSDRCSQLSDGNPMAYLELTSALNTAQRAGHAPINDALWNNAKLAGWLHHRFTDISAGTLVSLSVVAAADTASITPVQGAIALLDRTVDDLIDAEAAGLLRLEPGSVQLVHPLHRSAIASVVGADGMRRAHRALAEAYGDDVRSAWHWAAAAVGADEDAAIGLERLAERSIAMGAPGVAAEAYVRSAQLTLDSSQRFRRTLLAGQFWWEATDAKRAIVQLTEAMQLAETQPDRADVAGVLGDAIGWHRSAREGVELLQDQARAVRDQDAGRAAFLELRSVLLLGLAGDCGRSYEAAERAVELAEADGGLSVIAAYAVRALAAQMIGNRKVAGDDLAKILPFTDISPESHTIELQLFLQIVSYALMLQEDHDRVESILDGVLISGRRMGLEGVIGFTGGLISEVAFRKGRFVDAVFLAQPDVNLHKMREMGTASPGQAALTRACAALGRFDEAFDYGEQAKGNARVPRMHGLEAWAEAGIGLAYLGQGDIDQALRSLTRVARLAQDYLEPSFMWFESDLADALLIDGKRREAIALATSLERRCSVSGTIYGTAVAARIRGIDTEDQPAVLRSAETFRKLGAPFEEARSLLALAEYFGDENAAVESAGVFERIGAAPWADRAWRSSTTKTATSTLTRSMTTLSAAELRVAACVGRGRSNKEAAGELSLSARTVDAHLQAIYRKLDIKRRTELVLLFSATGTQPS
jgi:DNA-binding CsgD family transcriptional regulator/tetratricopeptide (TPR) repeat protein